MKKLMAIGEALIDMIGSEHGYEVKDAKSFIPKVGGAPANVCGAFVKLGGAASLITMLGEDAFGDKIYEYLCSVGIDCSHVLRTPQANTSLAFVSRDKSGNRSFSFYRNPGADMLLGAGDIREEWFADCYCLHFCSVSLGDFPMKEAHKKAIEYARRAGAIISFDPNLRLNLWDSPEKLRRAVKEFLPLCDILKISDEELEFITGKKDICDAADDLLKGNVKLLVYTKGNAGAMAFNAAGSASSLAVEANVVDTTGAGDAFIGSFLFSLCSDHVRAEELSKLDSRRLLRYLNFSNGYCAKSVGREGAIDSYPTAAEMGLRGQ